jgi:hypothetical protein|tara:strand:+ start:2177 stop:2395 length:219 start_codon:yes stop_codon:yes gene_type:complete
MSIKHRIKFKSDRDRGTRDANGAPLDLSDNAKASDDARRSKERVPDVVSPSTIWVSEDEEYCKHLAKFFKGE